MTDRVVRLTFPAKAEYLLLARLALSGLARELPLGDELLADLKLAVTEACGNAVRHAYSGGEGDVSVIFTIDDSRLLMTVADHGAGIWHQTRRRTRRRRSPDRSRAGWGCRSSVRSSTSWRLSRDPTAAARSSGW